MGAAAFYLNDPAAPKPNRPAHLGVNILLEWEGKLLLERRRDCGMWGLPGGGVKGREPERRAMVRELWEETGIRLPEATLQQVAVFGEPGRIASYPDGSVWRMVVILYRAELDREPRLRISAESKELRFSPGRSWKRCQSSAPMGIWWAGFEGPIHKPVTEN